MLKEEAIQVLLDAANYFEHQSAGYNSWGKVKVLQIAIRLNNNEILLTNENTPLASLTAAAVNEGKNHFLFQQAQEQFSHRKVE